ncbi:IpaC/SipC family type III secretion system effector [Pluralibacter sp.]|uniref:IpaC/SipC family type III secretion system effector n=1 Tax=Pluralibacter sp. TaxID=1920032 RepID=UPI0025D6F21F|nr:IpaC/SipC family type III secretion system effector [Pluralibacter sp.]MBV8045295.1 IpaC/SipC family type III secretion system effector [Pluralibacter sp.]
MTAINTVAANINRFSSVQDIEPKSLSKTVGINIGDIQPLLDKEVGKALGITSGGPELNAPLSGLSQDTINTLKTYLQGKQNDPDFLRSFGELHEKIESGVNKLVDNKVKEQAEQGKPLDISGFSSSAIALIVAANVLMLSLNTADSKLSGTLSLVSFDAAKSTASSIEREGMNAMSGAFAQSALQLGVTAVGAKTEHKGLSNERGALKNNGKKLEALNAERADIKRTLNTHNSTKLGADADGLATLETKSGKGKINQNINEAAQRPAIDDMAGDSVNLQASNQRLSPEHRAVLGSKLDELDNEIAIQSNALEDNQVKARASQATGRAITSGAQAVGGIAGASGQYAAALERSEQQISQASNQMAKTASEDTRESARDKRSANQELHNLLMTVLQDKNATNGFITGNIRV